MKADRFILTLFLVPSLALAQSDPVVTAPPMAVDSTVLPESAVTSPPPVFPVPDEESTRKLLEEEARRRAPVSTLPALQTPAAPPTSTSSGGGAMGLAMLGGLAALCAPLLAGQGEAVETSDEVIQAMDRYKDEQGFQDLPDYESNPQLGEAIAAEYPEGCENNFINKQGQLGPWGYTALEEIRRHPDVYTNNVPGDMGELCSGYAGFDTKKREQFWVWMFLAMAVPESGCRPRARNSGAPDGTAVGLFQVYAPFCDPLGVRGDLHNPHNNTRCAVRGLARELGRRDNLTSPTSKGSSPLRTYWAPLRNDHRDAGNAKANRTFESLLSKFPGC